MISWKLSTVDLKKLSGVVSKEVVKKTVYNKLNTKVNNFEYIILDASKGLVTTTILNTKIEEVENKIPGVSGLVKKTDYNAKISVIEEDLSNYNKLTCEIVDTKIKTLVTNSDLNNVPQSTNNNEEKNRKTKNVWVFFIGKNIFGGDDFQNTFVYQPTLV